MSRRHDRARIAASVGRARDTTRTPVMRPGSVVSVGRDVTVAMDSGDTVYAQCLGELPGVGQRVAVGFWPPHGAYIMGVYGGVQRTLAWVRQTVNLTVELGDGEMDLEELGTSVQITAPNRLIEVTVKVYCEATDGGTGVQCRVNDAPQPDGDRIDDYQARVGQDYAVEDDGNFMLFGAVIDDSPDVGERSYWPTLAFVDASAPSGGSVTALCENSPAEMWIRDIGPAVGE